MKPILDIIIPTMDNINMLRDCLNSFNLSSYGPLHDQIRYWVINNGKAPLKKILGESPALTILEPGNNLGWEGGLKLGLEHATAPLVLFANDDIRLVPGQKEMLWQMVSLFNDPSVGAAGPSSNFVMGLQNIFADILIPLVEVPYLIGFFFMVRREALDKCGGVDDSLPGGDDIDLSIRLRQAGYRLIADRRAFVFHHGAATGNRVHEGYWNSQLMQEKTNLALIKKHGMLAFWETVVTGFMSPKAYGLHKYASEDIEGDLCRKHVQGNRILELGCGGRKTVENAIGIDIHSAGDQIPLVTEGNDRCVSDLVADVSTGLPVEPRSQDTIIARHILEHCQDTIGTLSQWNLALKEGGTLIIAVPNNALGNTFLQNPEHVMSFVPSSLLNFTRFSGFGHVKTYEDVNGVSFVSVFEKIAEPYSETQIPEKTVHAKAAQIEEISCA